MIKATIINYGIGNIRSIYNAVKSLGANPEIAVSPSQLDGDKIILPGVGAFGDGMQGLTPFVAELKKAVDSGTPILGICLGMQMFFEGSQEAPNTQGLGLMKGEVVRIKTERKLPHIGWNDLEIVKDCALLEGIDDGYFYFVHSYHVQPSEEVVVATADYGCEVTAAVWKENLYGTQFHPEKSGALGLKVLKNFLEL